jgi:hypothetical protein
MEYFLATVKYYVNGEKHSNTFLVKATNKELAEEAVWKDSESKIRKECIISVEIFNTLIGE